MLSRLRTVAALAWLVAWACSAAASVATGQPEYRVKAAFLYNFALLTEWPPEVGPTLHLCVHGEDPFGAALDVLQGKAVGTRAIALRRGVALDALARSCQIVFIAPSAAPALVRVVDALRGQPVLTIVDGADDTRQGVVVHMGIRADARIGFEVDLRAAQAARLHVSSKLLRLAREVYR